MWNSASAAVHFVDGKINKKRITDSILACILELWIGFPFHLLLLLILAMQVKRSIKNGQ
jgi:hypothetical protein